MTMQIYKKEFKPYLVLSICLALLFAVTGNFWAHLPGDSFYEQVNFFFAESMLDYMLVNNHWLTLFYPSLLGLYLSFIGLGIGLLFYTYNNDSRYYRPNEEYGSARFAKKEEMARYADEIPEYNTILSKVARMGLFNDRITRAFQRNKNLMIIGDPGSGKTFNVLKPNILQTNASFLITDPKGLLIRECGAFLEKMGYKIKVFDLNTLLNSDHFNVFKYIKTELDIDKVLEWITEGTKKTDNQGEDFWIKAEGLLIRSFLAFLWIDGQDNDYLPHIGMVADMLRFVKRREKNKPSPVEEWFEEQNERHPNNYAYRQWTLFNDLYEAETRASVLGIAAARYSVFDHSQVVDLVRNDTMDIESWNEEKTAIFVTIPETTDSYNFLAAIFISTAMEVLRDKVDKVLTGEIAYRQLLHFRFWIDEFANIGRIPNIDKALASFRSRNMSIAIFLQALDQLKTMYKYGWASMANLCATVIFLGGDEEATVKYLSERIGSQTIGTRKYSHNKGRQGGGSENRDYTGRKLLFPDEIGRLNGDECLVFITKENVFKDEKFPVFDHPNAQYLANKPTDENWYRYKRYKDDVEEFLDKAVMVDHGEIPENI
ncbi:type IV secretory system conjugative DNA transfer family protein [Enterococcus cecorum]|nr:type IV secretory system conjugative DNA transfer family protein [Enterococcus cecorum]CAI3252131.1 type IV secretory system conjugative DNA transfer family protein [Enterococcus cecorum]CAI3252333.1 type IV secretory system conjugative DNA transfer family protein [Enterococcus cecorum]CAI3260701.1 type IV secretory system conjugative DNA transfer family protein [Enterococcus cecorum]CAI3284553.1 type IV secretory system conjugative DNA transfer family protein [Enterococcus cecorum]